MTDSKFATHDYAAVPWLGLLSSRGNPQQSCLIDGATSEAAITATEWIGSRSPRIWKLYMAYEQNGLAPEARAYLAHWGKSALWCSRFAKAPQSRGSNTWPRVALACARSAEDHDRGAAGTQGPYFCATSLEVALVGAPRISTFRCLLRATRLHSLAPLMFETVFVSRLPDACAFSGPSSNFYGEVARVVRSEYNELPR